MSAKKSVDDAPADERAASADGRQVVDVEQPRLVLALADSDEGAVDAVIEPQRRQDQSQRLPHRDVLQVADERAFDPRVGHDAERCSADEQKHQIANWNRLRERQREGAVVEIGGQRALVELGQRKRRELALDARRLAEEGRAGQRQPDRGRGEIPHV